MILKKYTNNAFTLIELLVVIAIIGILASLATVSFVNTSKQARDTQRKSDLKQYQSALEASASKHEGFYPEWPTGIWDNSWRTLFCPSIDLPSTCSQDPKFKASGDPSYAYLSDGDTGDEATRYVMWAELEMGGYWIVCSNGTNFPSNNSPSLDSCN